MRLIWKVLPQQKKDEEPLYGTVSESAEKETVEKQRKDLKDYLAEIDKTKEAEKEKFLRQAGEWENDNNFESLRKAGKSMQEDEKDPLVRHKLLSSAYLEEVKGRERLTYKINFRNNMLAEYKVGAGDIFPPNVSVIAVNGTRALRAINPSTERIGYYDEKEFAEGRYVYVPVFSGDIVEILETRESTDYLVQRRQMQERITLYRGRGATAVEEAELSPEEKRSREKAKITGEAKNERGALSKSLETQYAPSEDPAEVLAARRRLVETAKKYAGTRYFQENYFNGGQRYSGAVEGGRLGCALVVSSILKEAGYLEDLQGLILGVASTEYEMHKRGWTKTTGPIEAGDVLVWAPAVKRTDAMGNVKPGHGHIGIAVSPTEAVHNSNNYETDPATGKKKLAYKGPVMERIKRRPVAVWKPPGAMPGRGYAKAPAQRRDVEARQERVALGPVQHHNTKNLNMISRDHSENAGKVEINPQKLNQIRNFAEKFRKNRARYERVADLVNMPPELIAAIHYREGGCNFGTYLHNGQPLGKVTTIVPKGVFFRKDQWEEAAVDALTKRGAGSLAKQLGIDRNTTDMGKLLTFAEAYNGLGYRNKNTASPYVYAGTNMYEKGLYVADGRFSSAASDKGIGVAAMLTALHNPADYGINLKPGEALA